MALPFDLEMENHIVGDWFSFDAFEFCVWIFFKYLFRCFFLTIFTFLFQQTSDDNLPDILLIAINKSGVNLIDPSTKVGKSARIYPTNLPESIRQTSTLSVDSLMKLMSLIEINNSLIWLIEQFIMIAIVINELQYYNK